MTATVDAGRGVGLSTLGSVCGALAGVGGMTHAVGELLQGSVRPDGIVFDSWVQGPIARNLGGEPAMTVVPNLAVTGVLNLVVSLALIAWAVRWRSHRRAGTGLVVLSMAMLLVGGGFGPPMLGMLAGLVAGAATVRPSPRARRWLGGRGGRLLAAAWPGLYWLCAVNTAFLVLGSLAAGVLLDVAMPDVFVASLFLVVVSMPVAALAGIADRQRTPTASGAPARSTRRVDETPQVGDTAGRSLRADR